MIERPDPVRRNWPVRSFLRQAHAALYRATGGRIGHHVPGHPPMLLLAHVGADAEVQVGPEKIQVHAREADDGERQRLWPEAARYHPAWGRFQQSTLRTLPIVILTPRRE
jgi:F420H(2)-dependent quinone reductase